MLPPYLKRATTGGKGKAGRAAEKLTSKRLGASLTPGSGSLAGAKGDMEKGDFLIENKSSLSDSFSIKKDHLYKIYQEALESAVNPALTFQFVNADGKSERRDRWVVIPESVFQELISGD